MRTTQWMLPALASATLVFAGCSDDDETPPPSGEEVLLVVNSLGENLDVVETATGEVDLDVMKLGNVPNDLVVDQENGLFYVANSLDNDVRGYTLAAFDQEPVFDLGTNASPYALALQGEMVLVTNWVAGDLAYLDPATGEVDDRVPIGRGPQAILVHDGGVFVTVTDLDVPSFTYGKGEIVRVASGAVNGRVAVGTNPQDMVIDEDGRMHVVCTGNYGDIAGRIMVLNPATLAKVDSLELGGSPAYAAAAGGKIYVAGFFGGLLKYDAATLEMERGSDDPVIDDTGLGAMIYDAESERLYVPAFEDKVYVLDTSADTLVATWDVGDAPVAVALARLPEAARPGIMRP